MKTGLSESELHARSLLEAICRHLGYTFRTTNDGHPPSFDCHAYTIVPTSSDVIPFYFSTDHKTPVQDLLFYLSNTHTLCSRLYNHYPWVFYTGSSLDEIDINLALLGVH